MAARVPWPQSGSQIVWTGGPGTSLQVTAVPVAFPLSREGSHPREAASEPAWH